MTTVLLALALIAWLGSLLRYAIPDLDVDAARRTIGQLVLQVLLPALVFQVVVQVESGEELWRIPLTMLLGTLASLALAVLVFSRVPVAARERGALVLASSFGNVTYLGLPVLQGLFPALGLQAAKVAVLCEVTTTPLNLSLGASLGARYGDTDAAVPRGWEALAATAVAMLRQMARMPALWAVLIALLWRTTGVPVPAFLLKACTLLGQTVSGLMMLSLGMGLRYRAMHRPGPLLLAVALKLLVAPLLILAMATLLQVEPPYRDAVVLEGAMPGQLLTVVIADRVGLDVERLALCILLGTLASFVTLPLVQRLLLVG